ncbi:MAG: bifunctional diaminohydroxyphosphoribosylaminopyrimidine deaminase/5-amino-6-(5-phosphoribosylamino)uracil reductase RibD [Chthoniobacterales bacterium]|nr:bifunctional diaminohydroxyphosphoribosylaminopyrimidine deaminase/5-amino-6-(5-phosphoribosylamino)uracil reductase RibD [Chthoniobacterales bacterium]
MPSAFSLIDKQFMRLALREAWRGLGTTSPNPMVGAVIVANGKVLARGHHAVAGGPHAEIAALNNLPSRDRPLSKLADDDEEQGATARRGGVYKDILDDSSTDATPLFASSVEFGKRSRGATLYITLEPCSTHGRTPPCTEAIMQAGFARVVYGATDPNPQHQGTAKKILEQAGISVTTGILAEKCTALNHAWNHRMKTGMPWVIAKCGMSLDGRIATPGRRWITSEASRHHAMLFRRHVDAILVGGNTVRCDNPHLTIRGLRRSNELAPKLMNYGTDPFPDPYRVIWTRSKENIPKDCHLLTDEHRDGTIVLENCTLREGLQNLAVRGISSVLIEGGGITLGKAFEDGLVDEVRFYIAPLILGGGTLAISSNEVTSPIQSINSPSVRHLGPDLLIAGLVAK